MAKATSAELLAEFVGTFLLVFTVGCNVLSKNTVWGTVSIACVLMVAVYGLGGISGANFNPAVSVTLAITNAMKGPGGMDWGKCAMYCGVQIVAGIVGAFSYAILFWNAFYLKPAPGAFLSMALVEILYTFMLCFVVLNVAAARRYSPENGGQPNEWYGLAIGFVIIATNGTGCFNPAVAFGLDTASAGFHFGWCFVYTMFELIGAALAAVTFKVLVSEFLGTFILVLTVGITVLSKSPTGAFGIAASLMCMIYALGDISGAHFNPAVTLAIFISGLQSVQDRQSGKDVGLYMLVQCLGGIVAAFFYTLINQGKTFPLGPTPGHSWTQVLYGEVVFTFVLCFVVLCTAVSGKTKSKEMFGLAIGSCVTVGGNAIGSMGGGALNPAVAVGVASAQIWNGGMFYKAIYYSLFEFVGAAIAAGVVRLTHQSSK